MVLFVSSVLVRPNMLLRGETYASQNSSEREARSGQQRQQAQNRSDVSQASVAQDDGEDPDLPAFANGKVSKEDYLKARDEQLTLLRGLNEVMQKTGNLRVAAIEHLERQRAFQPALGPAWVQIGPAPIPLGQTQTTRVNVSGRTSCIAIDPNNSSNIYVGTAQGGVYRSLDGGTTWMAIFDSAQSLAIGALAFAPGDSTTLYVGTGEANGSADSFAGVGLYRLNNVTTSPVLTGPINPVRNYIDASSNPQSVPIFNGRSISKILPHPSEAGTLLVGVAGGVIGIGGDAPLGNTLPPLSMRGLYRVKNANGPPAGATGERIKVTTAPAAGTCFDSPCTGNRNINDIVYDTTDATGNTVVVWMNGINAAGDGGIYRTTNAFAADPTTVTFTQTFITTATATSNARGSFASYQRAGATFIYVASGEPSTPGTICNSAANPGAIRLSSDGGQTWSAKLQGGGGFCAGQCFYNIGLAVTAGASTATDVVYIAGNVRSTSCAKLLGKSTDGGATTFTNMDNTLHADTHFVAIDPSNPNILYHGNDGGVWKSTDAAANWTTLNNTGFHATQFQSVAVHPTDRFITIGGTQDNGSESMAASFVWTHADDGDGGYAVIDQSTPTTMYHTYFNQAGTQIGYARSLTGGTFGSWAFLGCSGAGTTNGIACNPATTTAVNFYCPVALGPGSPNNTIYIGTDRQLRSSTQGTANATVSQAPLTSAEAISSIGISPQNDNVRMVGQNNGAIWFTTSGSSTLTSLDAVGVGSVIPDKYVTRCVIDPNNQNIAYVTLSGYMGGTTTALSHVWKITNLNTTPVITGINSGLPDVPVNGFVVDPANSATLFAGTDIGVYRSTDTGASWAPFGSGLPIVSVFDMAIAQRNTASEFLRIATHGRGMWEADLGPTLAKVIDADATAYDNGQILLSWQTGSETDNLGFNVYREQNGQRVPVTRQIIAGSSLMTGPGDSLRAEHSYKWADTPPPGLKRVRYWIEDIGLSGESKWTGPIDVKLARGNVRAASQQNAALLATLGFRNSAESAGSESQPAQVVAQPAKLLPAALQTQASLAAQPALKISVKQEGWYRVSQPDLVAAGLNPNINPRNLQMYVDGNQVPLLVKGEQDGRFDAGDAIEFYGIGVNSAVTDKRVYWLVAGSEPGLRVRIAPGKGGPSSSSSFPYTVERKDRTIYFSSLRNGEAENFFGPVVARTPVSQVVTVQHPSPSSGTAAIDVSVQGVTRLAHKVKVSLNGTDIGEINFTGQVLGSGHFIIPQSKVTEGDNTVTLVAAAGNSDVNLIDSVRITYQHNLVADNDLLQLTTPANQQTSVDGFGSSSARAVDVTDPAAPQDLRGIVKPGKTGYTISFAAPGTGQRRVLVFSDSQAKRPVSIALNQPSNWRQPAGGADLLILTRRDFFASVEPLRVLREKQGISSAVVDVEDVYDEFSFGQKSPQAIKDFILFARNNWGRPPRFALFVGDASLDPKNYLGFGDFDFVSTKLIDTQLLETSSDDWFADSNQDGVPEIAIGRLPARTPTEAARMVAKIVGYDASQTSNGVLLVSDTNDTYNFQSASAQLRGLIPDGINVREINRGQLGDAEAKAELLDSINQGRGIVNYAGHGNVAVWRANLLTQADARALTNEKNLPFFVTMTCLNGYFQDPSQEALAESLMEAERGGAIAVWASSGMTEPSGQVALDQQVFRAIYDVSKGQGLTLGEAVVRAKALAGDPDIRRTWILFGDPSMRLK